MNEIERLILQVEVSLSAEDVFLREEDRSRLLWCGENPQKSEGMKRKIVQKYKRRKWVDAKPQREITAIQLFRLKQHPLKGGLDFSHLKAIHRYIFSDLFSWAGKVRLVDPSGEERFCPYGRIEINAAKLFGQLREEAYLSDTSKDLLAERLAYYLSELHALHPFAEGNGVTGRLFIEYLAAHAGYRLDFSLVEAGDIIEANLASLCCEYDKMCHLIQRMIYSV